MSERVKKIEADLLAGVEVMAGYRAQILYVPVCVHVRESTDHVADIQWPSKENVQVVYEHRAEAESLVKSAAQLNREATLCAQGVKKCAPVCKWFNSDNLAE